MNAVDLFCGAGGTSTGILRAAASLKRRISLVAVNHWRTAINSHSLNQPSVAHICEPVENVHPLDLIKSGRLRLLAASCECRFHSVARGGGPCNEQSRSQPWQIVRWATDIQVDDIMMENVPEFLSWGPLSDKTKKPIKSEKGKHYKAFINALLNLGYSVDAKVQNAADFGDPTSRRRLIIMARRGKKEILWPKPTHGEGRPNPHRSARQIIDWSIKGTAHSERKRPLRPNTIRRIMAGIQKMGGQPFLIGQQSGATPRSVNNPVPTIATAGAISLIEPFIMHLTHQGKDSSRCHSVEKPLPVITTAKGGEMALVEPFIVKLYGTGKTSNVDKPLPTVTSGGNHLGLCEPFLVKYYGTASFVPIDQPLPTVTVRDRFMLIEPCGRKSEVDFRFRMLQPHELAAAHSFPAEYRFTGTKHDQVKQIGNSVPVELAAAHARSLLENSTYPD